MSSLVFDQAVFLYGTGKQVRDILHVSDLIKAFDSAFKNIKKTKGKVYTIGGGSGFAVSILDFFKILENISDRKFNYKIKPWRLTDQKVYISDVSSAKKDFNWTPNINPKEGIKTMYDWVLQNKHLIDKSGILKNKNK